MVNINGKETKLYTPFVVVCGSIFDNTIHRNIEISSGKVIDDGTKTFVIGMCLPGLKESLDMEDINVPNKIEITMDTTSFETGNIASFVTPKIFEESDMKIFDDLDEVYSKVDTLESSSKELEKGANTLKDGASTFYEKSKEFNEAMKKVSEGAESASSSYTKIDDGISTLADGAKKISDGSSSLSSALGDVSNGISGIKGGTKQLKDGADTMYSEIQKFMAKLDIPETDPKSMQSQLKALISGTQTAIDELNEANEDLQGKLDDMDKKIKALEAKLESLDEASSEYSETFAMLESARARKKSNGSSN